MWLTVPPWFIELPRARRTHLPNYLCVTDNCYRKIVRADPTYSRVIPVLFNALKSPYILVMDSNISSRFFYPDYYEIVQIECKHIGPYTKIHWLSLTTVLQSLSFEDICSSWKRPLECDDAQPPFFSYWNETLMIINTSLQHLQHLLTSCAAMSHVACRHLQMTKPHSGMAFIGFG